MKIMKKIPIKIGEHPENGTNFGNIDSDSLNEMIPCEERKDYTLEETTLPIEIKVDNISYEICKQILKYLYTDECDISLENAMGLFKAADVYKIERLKSMCEQSIVSCIEVDNVASIFLESDHHKAEALRNVAL